jgi:cytochrome b involved in lipid metabolism
MSVNRTTAPARAILDRAEATNRSLGHENLGFLSAAHGFMPSLRPRERLPQAFEAWDFAAAALPELHASLELRSVFDRLPTLAAEAEHLPDAALLRAAHVLAMLAHAYYYVETRPPDALPAAITAPWARVRERLGRRAPVLSYIDLIVYNFRLIDPAAPDPFRVENMRLLTPTVDTREEHVFYLTQTEILARAAPIVGAVVRAQESVIADDPTSLAVELRLLLSALEAMRRSLRKIDPRAASPTHVDPVIWAKTVAPFAVPMVAGAQGPSGTSSPIFSLLDTFLERRRHETTLGREIRDLRQWYPLFWRDLLEAVRQVSVSAYVAARNERETTDLHAAVTDAYAGDDGFLGAHRRKVYGYLEIAFKVGRSVTIGGFAGRFHDRTWNQVDAELEASRRERPGTTAAQTDVSFTRRSPVAGSAPTRAYHASELILRNGDSGGCWIAFEGHVYDLTAFLLRHPGGAHVLRLHAGMDGTGAFGRAHREAATPLAWRERYRLGPLGVPALDGGDEVEGRGASLARLYRRWLRFAYLVVEMQNALRLDIGLQSAVIGQSEGAAHRSPYKLQQAVETQERFVHSCLATCSGPLVEELWRDTDAVCLGHATGSSRQLTARSDAHRGALARATDRLERAIESLAGADGGPASARLTAACEALEQLAEETVADVKSVFHQGLQAFERHESRLVDRAPTVLSTLLAGLPAIIGAYYDGAVLALRGPLGSQAWSGSL